jgi:hypothetical protein
MMMEMAVETSMFYGHLPGLIVREDFTEFSRSESYKSYTDIPLGSMIPLFNMSFL